MNKLNNRFIVLGVGILLSVAYPQSHASDEIEDTMDKLAELMAPTPSSAGNSQPKISQTQVVPEVDSTQKKEEPLKTKSQAIISKDAQEMGSSSLQIDRSVENITTTVAPIAEKLTVEREIKVESREENVKKVVEPAISQNKKKCELCLGPIQIERELKTNGSVQIKIKVIVTDNKGRLALGSPVLFYATNNATPNIYDTQTSINGEAFFTFTTFHPEQIRAQVLIDKIKYDLAIN